jgi:hypothetical protein
MATNSQIAFNPQGNTVVVAAAHCADWRAGSCRYGQPARAVPRRERRQRHRSPRRRRYGCCGPGQRCGCHRRQPGCWRPTGAWRGGDPALQRRGVLLGQSQRGHDHLHHAWRRPVTPKTARGPVRWFLRTTGYAGICLPPVGIYILAEHLYSDRLIRHEQAHWRQWQRMGTIRFYTAYLWGLLRHGYRNHPMEIEARGEEDGAR